MKTAISIPDPVFARAEEHARRLGLSRSEFFSRAVARWADELEGEEITAAIDAALAAAGEDELGGNGDFLGVAAARSFARLDRLEEVDKESV
ncbi:MAG TPA: ribbon-helix-helix protein, CopG family [Acidimicrobiales bacterium]|nr:ribbon-helix-helix protein, CopG family [Acidimicrobiales bacterium]